MAVPHANELSDGEHQPRALEQVQQHEGGQLQLSVAKVDTEQLSSRWLVLFEYNDFDEPGRVRELRTAASSMIDAFCNQFDASWSERRRVGALVAEGG